MDVVMDKCKYTRGVLAVRMVWPYDACRLGTSER